MTIDMTKPAAEPTWEDVWAAIGREVWKLAPQDHQDSGHRDLMFLTCWQHVMEAVDKGIASCYPDDRAQLAEASKSPAGGGVIRGPGGKDDHIGFPLETGFLLRAKQPACNVAGCDHTKPDECRIDRCATCNEPYDGTEPPDRHIARAHVES